MRPIEFRAKAKNSFKGGEQWLYGPLALEYGFYYTIYPILFERFNQVDPNTIGQYVGRKDKNKTKLFELDVVDIIVTVYSRRDPSRPPVIKKYRATVRWSSAKAMFGLDIHPQGSSWTGIFPFDYFGGDPYEEITLVEFEVVGNTIDNPELDKEDPFIDLFID